MARVTPASDDKALRKIEDALSLIDDVTAWIALPGQFNLSIWGAFVGTVLLERSFDGGDTAITCTSLGQPVTFNAPASEVIGAPEDDVLWRLRVVAISSGVINVRLSQ